MTLAARRVHRRCACETHDACLGRRDGGVVRQARLSRRRAEENDRARARGPHRPESRPGREEGRCEVPREAAGSRRAVIAGPATRLPKKLAEGLDVQTGVRAVALRRRGDGLDRSGRNGSVAPLDPCARSLRSGRIWLAGCRRRRRAPRRGAPRGRVAARCRRRRERAEKMALRARGVSRGRTRSGPRSFRRARHPVRGRVRPAAWRTGRRSPSPASGLRRGT